MKDVRHACVLAGKVPEGRMVVGEVDPVPGRAGAGCFGGIGAEVWNVGGEGIGGCVLCV